MSDTPPVPPVPPVSGVPPVEPPSVVVPPPPPAVPEAARPDPYTQPAYAQPASAPPAPSPYAPQYGYAPRTNPLAIVSLVLSLVAIFIWFFGSVAAVICGHIALNQIKRTGEGGRGLALAGVIIGYVGLGFAILIGIIYAVIIVAAVSSNSYGN